MFLALERLFLRRVLERIPSFFSRIYSLAVVYFGWVLFRFRDPQYLSEVISGMFGGNDTPLVNFELNTIFLNYVFFLIVAIIAVTPLMKRLGEAFRHSHGIVSSSYGMVQALIPPVFLLLSTAALVGNSYNPFLYFQF